MFPFCDSSSNNLMDLPLYHQLQLSPPSPKPDQSTSSSFFYYPCSPPPFAAAADASFHLTYHLGSSAAATPPQAVIDSPEELPVHPLMDQAPAPAPATTEVARGGDAQGVDRARKDRHSKICTAGGMRDRRMRLSLDVARKFFALQDMLGFDKASKTVQWLLNTSKSAIQEIMADDASSAECVEDGSSSLSVDAKHKPEQLGVAGGGGDEQQPKGDGKKSAKPSRKAAATNPKPARKAGNAAHPVPDKETRAKARERARERTKEKHRMRWVKLASAIDVEARDSRPPGSNNLNHHQASSSTNMACAAAAAAAAELEERSSSTLNNGGRMQEITGASDVILAFGNNGGYGGGAGGGNYYCGQEQWDLGGVVFQQNNSRFY